MREDNKVIRTDQAALLNTASRGVTIPAVVLSNRAPYFGLDGFNSAAGVPLLVEIAFRIGGAQIYRSRVTGTTRLGYGAQGLVIPTTCDNIRVTNVSGVDAEAWESFIVLGA